MTRASKVLSSVSEASTSVIAVGQKYKVTEDIYSIDLANFNWDDANLINQWIKTDVLKLQ